LSASFCWPYGSPALRRLLYLIRHDLRYNPFPSPGLRTSSEPCPELDRVTRHTIAFLQVEVVLQWAELSTCESWETGVLLLGLLPPCLIEKDLRAGVCGHEGTMPRFLKVPFFFVRISHPFRTFSHYQSRGRRMWSCCGWRLFSSGVS